MSGGLRVATLAPREHTAPAAASLSPNDRVALLAERDRLQSMIAQRGGRLRKQREEIDAALTRAQEKHATAVAATESELRLLEVADRRAATIEREARRTCDPAIAEHGPLLRWLQACRDHLVFGGHLIGVAETRMREMLRDIERINPKPGTASHNALLGLRQQIETHERATTIAVACQQAAEAIRAMQVAPSVDVNALEGVIATIPEHCVCGDALPLVTDFTESEA